ncbi:MAG: amidohydrolase family protein [Planctomycetota bacterium]|nr:amidohydrolase family protein [Planctomycetota bacterium]
MDAFTPQTLAARFLFPVKGSVIEGGTITMQGGKITAIEREPTNARAHDLGNVAILPGLINAHTHLEFSALTAPLGEPGMPLPEWIEQVVRWRRAAASETATPVSPDNAVQQGLCESLRHGVTGLGEICTTDWKESAFPASPASCTLFREQIGLSPERSRDSLRSAGQWLAEFTTRCSQQAQGPTTGPRYPGLSPHAPYTVDVHLLESLCSLARKSDSPVAMHLAESPEEVELLRTGKGALAAMLDRLGARDPASTHAECSPYDYLLRLVNTPRLLVIHGNYLNQRELDLLTQHRDHVSIIYCPRTHAFFKHTSYPWDSVLARGIPLALGTDSRASNPDLNLLAEMRFLLGQTSSPSPQQVLQLGTSNGARALGRHHEMGVLQPGMLANLIVVRLPDRRAKDPHELLFAPESKVIRTYVHGDLVHAEEIK